MTSPDDTSLPRPVWSGRHRWTVPVIVLVATLLALYVRWYFVVHAQVVMNLDTDQLFGDAAQFYRYAWHMAHNGVFSSDPISALHPRPDGFRDPAYPAVMALGMMLTDDYERWYQILLLSQVALGGAAVAFAALAMRDVAPPWLLAVGALGMALWPHLVAIPAYVMCENLTTPLCALAAFAMGEASRRKSLAYVLVGAGAMAVAALSNAVLGPVVVVLAAVFAWRRTLARRQLVAMVIVGMLPLVAWGVRNATLATLLTPTLRAEVNLVEGSWPTYHAASQLAIRDDPVGLQTIKAINTEIAILDNNKAQGLSIIASRIAAAPWTYAKWYLAKPTLTWGWEIALGQGDIYPYPTRRSPFMVHPAFKAIEAMAYILNGVLALFAVAGLVVTLGKKRAPASMLTFGVTAAWITLVYWVLQSDARYSIAYRPGQIALACVGIYALVGYLRDRRRAGGDVSVSRITP